MKRFLKISLTFCVITSFFFAGCKNFMNGNSALAELNSAIDYANAESITVLINSTDGSGSFLTGNGEKKLKVGDSVEVEFKVNDAWQFQKWIAVDKDNQSKNLTNYIKFSNSTSTKTTITLLAKCENILIMPKCVERLKIASYLPDTKNEVPYNTDIFITFNYNISQSSITYSTEELESLGIDDSYELIKITQPDNSEAVYGYKKNNITYFKNIEITSSSGENLNEYFNPPQLISGKTLLITKNDVPFIFDSTNKKSITVSVAPNFSEKSGISVGTKGASFAYTINETSKVVEPTVKIDFSTEKEYGTITPSSAIECSLQKDYDISFTETKEYKFVRWEAVYNDGTNDSAEDMVLIKDKTAKNTTFQLKYAIPGLVIKAICEKRPEVEGVFPLNLSLGTARNTNITITFSEPIQDLEPDFFNFDSEKCIISLKDTNGVELNKYYSTPFINYDKKTVIIPANSSNIIRASTKVVVSIDLSLFKNENGISVANEPSLYSWEFTTGNSIINTPPVIQYFRIAVSEENVHNTNGKYFSPINSGYNIEVNPQNHAGKTVYGYINTYDNESKPKYLYITETLLKDVNGNSISSSDPYTEKQELKFESPLATDTYFSYTFNTSPERVDGLYKLEFYIEDDFEDSLKLQSEVITYYVVKDTICDGLKNLIINNNSSIIKYGDNNNETNVPNNTGMPIQYSSDNSGRKIRSYYYNLNDIGGGITDFEIKGFVDSNYFNDGTEKFKEEYIVEIYKGYARTEDATNTKIHYTYKDNKYIFSINENDIDTSKDLFIRVVFSDAVGNSETYYVAFPKIPDLNILKVTNKDDLITNKDDLKFITPEIINYNTDSYADIKYRFFAKNSNNKDSNVISAHYYESNDGHHILYADANPVSAEDKFLLTINATDKYDLYIQPVYCYSYGNATIYGAPTKIPEKGYQYSDSLNSELLEFDVETINNKNGTCTLTVKLNSEKKEGVTYSVLCIAKNISQTVPLEKASFTLDCSEVFDVTIAIFMNDDREPAAIKTVNVNIDCLPPYLVTSSLELKCGNTFDPKNFYINKIETPLADKHSNLYNTESSSITQDLYYSEDEKNFKQNGIKVTVPVEIKSKTNAIYSIDIRNLKFTGKGPYKANDNFYVDISDTQNNKYSGLFSSFECNYNDTSFTITYNSENKNLSVQTGAFGSTDIGVEYSKHETQGYIEYIGKRDTNWTCPEKLKGTNNVRNLTTWRRNTTFSYAEVASVSSFDLSEINSNCEVLRVIGWRTYSLQDRLMPHYYFLNTQDSLKYGILLSGTNGALLYREENANIPTLVYAKYSNFDYGTDINLWEIGGFETATQVVYDTTGLQVSSNTSDSNYVPSGKYYVFIARFADGTTSISNVFKK